MTDMTSMIADFASRQEERHEKRKLKLDHLKAVTLAALRTAEITSVEITFDGYGDSGSIDDITCLSADASVADCPDVQVAAPDGGESETEPSRTIALSGALEDIGYIALELHHPGWEINEGSAGALEIDVAAGTFILECRTRFIDYDEQVTKI